MNECAVVELSDGRLMMNMRSYRGNNRRAVATSRDGGETWGHSIDDPTLIEPVCQASFIRFDGSQLLFSNPASKSRNKMTVRLSRDEGKTWLDSRQLHAGPAAYSNLTVMSDNSIGIIYERGEKSAYETITFARFTLEWLTSGK
jgi:sialidase-1